MISAWTYSTPVGFGCCGSEPSGLQCGTVLSSWQCCSSKAGCSLRCERSRRWSLSGTGAAVMRYPAALTPAGRSHWEGRTGGGERKRGPDRGRRKMRRAQGEGMSNRERMGTKKGKARGREDGFISQVWCLSKFFCKNPIFFSVMLSWDLFIKIVWLAYPLYLLQTMSICKLCFYRTCNVAWNTLFLNMFKTKIIWLWLGRDWRLRSWSTSIKQAV